MFIISLSDEIHHSYKIDIVQLTRNKKNMNNTYLLSNGTHDLEFSFNIEQSYDDQKSSKLDHYHLKLTLIGLES